MNFSKSPPVGPVEFAGAMALFNFVVTPLGKMPIMIMAAVGPRVNSPMVWKQEVNIILSQCRFDGETISRESDILGGIPHIAGTRLSVGQVLGRVRVLGSIQAVVDYYAPDITEEQVKDAIAYAQDFVEIACEPG